MKKIIILFFITLICILPVASASPTTLQITPPSKVLQVGETFNITINVIPGQDIDTVAIDLLRWNAGIIDCISVQKGNLFANPLIWMSGKINNTAGKLQYLVMASNVPTAEEKQFCTITFKAKMEGISTISILESGVARNGTALTKKILNSCQLTVGTNYIAPSSNITSNNSSKNTSQTNQTKPIDNTTQPVTNNTNPSGNDTTNQTLIPISNINNTNKSTNKEAISPGLLDNIPPTTIIYAIVAIVIISVFSYIIIRHFQHKQEDREDEEMEQDIPRGETDLDDFITHNFGA